MAGAFLIGLDFGTESGRGVLLDAVTGEQLGHHVHPYRHHVMADRLADGTPLPIGSALQDPADYLEAVKEILSALGRGRTILSIGVDFTASSPLPVTADGTPLSFELRGEPHAYVKLWKHATAQPYADAMNAAGGDYLRHCGGRMSGEWMLAKAAQIAQEAPEVWNRTERFIEAGDWLVWQLTGREARGQDFAAFKAHYQAGAGYPNGVVPGLERRWSAPHPAGSPAGEMTAAWRERTGILGRPVIAVAMIDSHVVFPAIGAVNPGTLVGALGTSAVFLLLAEAAGALPQGLEAMAHGAVLPNLWCFEAGLAGFGDMLLWFVRTFPRSDDVAENFRLYNADAAHLRPGESHLVGLDWWSGNRVPFGDPALSGVLLGLNVGTTAAGIYRALLETLAFGSRNIIDHMEAGNLAVERIVLTSGLAHNNPLLVQLIADVMCRAVEVPNIANPTAVAAAIHGAVAGSVVRDFCEGAERFGNRDGHLYQPNLAHKAIYDRLYDVYRAVSGEKALRVGLHAIRTAAASIV